MASNNQTFKIALPSTKQLRPRAGTGDPCNAAAMSTLSDRVAKRGWTRKVGMQEFNSLHPLANSLRPA